MFRPTVLLRLLLSLALILNGIGGAVASTGMQMEHMGWMHGAMHADAAEQSAQPPCHEHAGVTSSDKGTDSGATANTPAKTKQSPDCCKSGTCRCLCVHQSQVAITALLPAPVIEHAGVMRPLKPGHAAPALPHLIRPPIG